MSQINNPLTGVSPDVQALILHQILFNISPTRSQVCNLLSYQSIQNALCHEFFIPLTKTSQHSRSWRIIKCNRCSIYPNKRIPCLVNKPCVCSRLVSQLTSQARVTQYHQMEPTERTVHKLFAYKSLKSLFMQWINN